MDEEKIFLFPQDMRRGSPTLMWVERYTIDAYHLGVASVRRPCLPPPCKGSVDEYEIVTRAPVSKAFYDAFVKESERNHGDCTKNNIHLTKGEVEKILWWARVTIGGSELNDVNKNLLEKLKGLR
jgi:hypothetical protein